MDGIISLRAGISSAHVGVCKGGLSMIGDAIEMWEPFQAMDLGSGVECLFEYRGADSAGAVRWLKRCKVCEEDELSVLCFQDDVGFSSTFRGGMIK